MPKTSLRKTMLARRRALEAEACYSSSLKVQQRFVDTAEFLQARSVGLYSSILNEVFTEEIFKSARTAGKSIFYPRVEGESLTFIAVADPGELRPGAFGILEPVGREGRNAGEIDLIVVPGIAFDWTGHRLGFGQGYYDRVLRELGPEAIPVGLGFDWQVVEKLPNEPHDIRMHLIVTETETIRSGKTFPALTGNFDPK